MKKVLITTALLLFAGTMQAQELSPQLTLPTTSIAVTDNVLGTVSNPAWLGFRRGAEMLLAFPYNDSASSEDLSLFVKLGSLGFAGEFDNDGPVRYNRYTLAQGAELGSGFYMGASYSWYRVVDWDGSWNIGLGFRPLPFLSAGAVAYDINQPNHDGLQLEPSYGLALAFRPLDYHLTLSGDLLFTRDATHDYGDELDPLIRIEAIPFDGIRLTGEYRTDSEAFGIGLSLAIDNFALGNYRQHDDQGDHLSSVGYIHLTSGRQATIFKPRKRQFVEITLGDEIRETMPQFLIFRPVGRTLHRLRQEIVHYADDPDVEGMVIKFENPEMGFAQAQQLRRTLEEFKLTGKRLIAYSEDYSQRDYYLASVCDEVYLMHVGGIDLRGLAALMGYWRGTLDKLGIGVQVVRVGDYKTAANAFEYTDATEAEAEMLNWLLDDLYEQICGKISEGRNWELEEVKQIIDGGPYYSTRALENGLIDDLLYYDEITTRLEDEDYAIISEDEYWRFPEYEEEWPDVRIPKVAVIYAEGAIVQGESSDGWFGDQMMGSETIAAAIRTAREDNSIDAIILRVDSPGGSAFASEVIYREVRRTATDEKQRKPIIVSMGNVAGSGGYYISCGADTVIAEEGTITGSIGVLGGKLNLQGLHKKIYHNVHPFKRGEHSDVWRMHRPFSDEEMEMLQEAVEQIYHDFVARVAESRPLTAEEIDAIGEGRVWTGKQAQENGLVDLIGGMDLAFEITRSVVGVEAGAPLQLDFYPKPRGFFASLSSDVVKIAGVNPLPKEWKEAVEPFALMAELYNGEPLMFMPYEVEIK